MTLDNDLRDALARAATNLDPPPARLDVAINRGHKRVVVRMMGNVVAGSVVLGAVVGSVLLLQSGFHKGPVLPASEGHIHRGVPISSPPASSSPDTYLLSEFRVEYPDEHGAGSASPDMARAGVTFNARWSGSRFPGNVWCSIVLKDASGAVVGTSRFLASYDTPTAVAPPVTVDVSAAPASADGSCESGTYVAGPGYTFDNLRVEANTQDTIQGQSAITFTAHWATPGVDPSERTCALNVLSTDGQTQTSAFGYEAPDGTDATFGAAVPPDQVKDAWVTCTELKR